MSNKMWTDIAEWVKTWCFQKTTYDGDPIPIELTPLQEKALKALADYKTVIVCVPKRQGKTMLSALAAIYAAFKPNTTVTILSTSREHAQSVAFRRVVEILNSSKKALMDYVNNEYGSHVNKPERLYKVSQSRVEIPSIKSVIETVPCTTEAVAGRVYNFAIIDELALIDDEETVSVLMGQSERADARVLITSTASDTDHLLYRLYKNAVKDDRPDEPATDPTSIVFYRSGIEFYQSAENNPMITPDFLTRMKRAYLPHLFQRYFLNEFGSASSDIVFTPDLIVPCVRQIEPPKNRDEAFQMFPDAVRIRVGVGIDRALPFSQHGDQTAGTLLLKILMRDGSVIYFVAESVIFPTGRGSEILDWILTKHRDWLLSLVTLEVYQTADIKDALDRHGVNTKYIHVSQANKTDAFNFLYQTLSQQKIIVPERQAELIKQIESIRYKRGKFEASHDTHDDLVYSLIWILREL